MELLGASTKRNVGGGADRDVCQLKIELACLRNPHGHERALKEEEVIPENFFEEWKRILNLTETMRKACSLMHSRWRSNAFGDARF